MVRAKKHLGQHFLDDREIADRIVHGLECPKDGIVLEIGPGTGVLTSTLSQLYEQLYLCEVDVESIEYLAEHYPFLKDRIMQQDFLKLDLAEKFDDPVHIIGNFPYNISSQIMFQVLEHKDQVPELVGMFQKEVAQRIIAGPGSKVYGIISVLINAFYDTSYLFTVPPDVFIPPPKVDSGVIRITRNGRKELPCDEKRFIRVVKTAFNQRRKTLRNSLKSLLTEEKRAELPFAGERPERLGVEEFIELTQFITQS